MASKTRKPSMPKHGRNVQKNLNKIAKYWYKMGGVESGRINVKRKPGEVKLPVLLHTDKRCQAPKPDNIHSEWIDSDMTEDELNVLMTRIADKQHKAFNVV